MEEKKNSMDITVIIPVHTTDYDMENKLSRALESVKNAAEQYVHGYITTVVVCPPDVENALNSHQWNVPFHVITNDTGNTDFCSQINYAVQNIDTEWFSILEWDDTYYPIWFKNVYEYRIGRENCSMFMPMNVVVDATENQYYFGNEMAWAMEFSSELGTVDFDCLQTTYNFNVTGAVINTKDFISAGMYKPSIKLAFNYELLLRMTNSAMGVYVVPKEGYLHTFGSDGSLGRMYIDTIPENERGAWFDLAKREYTFTEDRGKGIVLKKEEKLQ